MKKFLIFVLLVAAGYFAYEYLIKEKEVLEINADKLLSTAHSMDADAPALSPTRTGAVGGTVKNISDKVVTNIVLKYQMDAKPVEARIDRLEPGETKNFSTQSVSLRYADPSFYLEEVTYD
ncbi:MAG TPA: hypothetical protein VK870_07315 [Ignavibacteriaceae bacterium]|nr:hypothetical protein [Ignavibacteriaceae bacterium]